jgi:hypothetical protein
MSRDRGSPARAAIKDRAESGAVKTGAAKTGAAKTGAAKTGAPEGRPSAPALRDRLWSICSPVPAEGYAPPWDQIAADLSARLLTALQGAAKSPDRAAAGAGVAAAAALPEYSECARALARSAPAVYRVFADVRGLAAAAAPAPGPQARPKSPTALPARPGIQASVVPGLPLEYESLA